MKQDLEELQPAAPASKGILLSQGARKELMRLRNEGGYGEEAVLRLGVKGGGCAGFSYVLEFGEKQPGDLLFPYEGITVAVEPLHEMYLNGTELDFEGGLGNRGFTYKNPNAEKTCGCGSSFG